MKIAIIDSGIDEMHPCFARSKVSGASIIYREKVNVGEDYTDMVGHGTAVCGIIASHEEDAELCMVRIVENAVSTNDCNLVAALQYIDENIECDIINISMGVGVLSCREQLYGLCVKFWNKGIPIVAAFDNMGSISYPAAFDCVVGVTSSPHNLKSDEVEILDGGIVNVCAKGSAQRVAWVNPSYYVTGGDSMACAHMTGIIAHMMKEKKISARETVEILGINLTTNEENIVKRENPYMKCRKAALFPFNKEMHSLLRFEELLPFEIRQIYDLRTSGRVGADAYRLLGMQKEPHIIKNIDSINYEDIDLLVVGHVDVLHQMNKDFDALDYVQIALERGIKVYSLDDLADQCSRKDGIWGDFFSPQIRIGQEDLLPMGKLYRTGLPVLGVFGTSSQQGKWTLQLELRKRFMEDGYTVGQIGTEPTAYLFGMDACYHFGYNASTDYTEHERISYINSAIHRMEMSGAEIVIGGSQSFTITYDFGNLVQYPLQQYSFLLGLRPDLSILCVNNTDDLDYVENTVKFIEAAVDSKVIGAVLFPVDINSYSRGFGKKQMVTSEQEDELRSYIGDRLGINLYRLDNQEQLDALYQDMFSYL